MFGSTVIDLVIAIAAIFLVFSLVTSGLRELMAKVLATRAKELWRTLRRLLDDPLASDLRELRAIENEFDATAGEDPRSLRELIDTAESTLRAEVAPRKARAWRATVKQALAPIREAVSDDHAAVVTRTERRLWLRHPGGSRGLVGAMRAWRRGGDRPLVPVEPHPTPVAALAAEVRRGTKTLTDAVNEHPLVRQIDRSWKGYLSRMKRLESEDFSVAVLEIVRSAGLEPALSAAFEPVMHQLDELYPDESADELFWEPIAGGLGEIVSKFENLTTTPADVSAAVAKIRVGIEDVIEELGEISEAEHALLLERIEAAQGILLDLVEHPLHLVRRGAELLDDGAPVKDALLRLAAGPSAEIVDVGRRMEELREGVAEWYESRMDALSAWYRHRTRLVSFALALAVVIGFNVDAVHIPLELWRNDQVRELVVATAGGAQSLIGSCIEGVDGTAEAAAECVESRVDQLVDTGLPLGWELGTTCDGTCNSVWEDVTYAVGIGGAGWGGVVIKPMGWILAAAAVSVGASFWYDTLRRATGAKKSPEPE